jgi:hypothetical protein
MSDIASVQRTSCVRISTPPLLLPLKLGIAQLFIAQLFIQQQLLLFLFAIASLKLLQFLSVITSLPLCHCFPFFSASTIASLSRPPSTFPRFCNVARQECKKGYGSVDVSSNKRILRVVKTLRIFKIMRLLKGIKLVE